MTPEVLSVAGTAVGVLLTVLILSYLIHDNPLYRLALHLLVGVTVGYGVAVVTYTVFVHVVLPALQAPVQSPERWGIVMPLLLGLLLLLKGFPHSRFVSLGNLSTGFLIGVGAAVAAGGALTGTIIPQVGASGSIGDWIGPGGGGMLRGLVVVVGTVSTLLLFTFTVPRSQTLRGIWGQVYRVVGGVGRLFLVAGLGAAFGAALTASLSVLIGRIYAVIDGIQYIIQFSGR